MGKSQSKQSVPQAKDGNFIGFALVGSSGSGKSAFVNAVRGIGDEHENAARVHIVDAEQSPKEYVYPSHPHVSFCDLPGYGTPSYPDLKTYWKKLKLETFNAFLIFIRNRVMAFDLELIERIKSRNKSYLIIRSKIDVEWAMENEQRQCKEELLTEIRDYIIKRTDQLLCTEEIFLISSYDPHNWDFFRLVEAMMKIMPDPEIDATSNFTEQYMADVKTHIRKNGVTGIEVFFKEKLEQSKNLKIRFGITGDSGAGKSSFTNAIRGLKKNDDGAAKVGVVEATTEPTEYQHPRNEKIIFVDLPGIGTPGYPDLETYCKKVDLEKYDTFLIFSATRFTQNDLVLAKKVKSIGKSFFFIRTKIDVDCTPHNGETINEEEILEQIRNNCMTYVKGLISSERNIFLISNYHKDKWDFDRLIEAISDALPVIQRECLTLSLSNVTRECLKRKVKIFKAQAFLVAAASAGTGAIPIPGVGGVMDFLLIGGSITVYYRELGLNDTEPGDLELLEKKIVEIIQRYQFRTLADLASTFATKTFALLLGFEEVSVFIPIVGMVLAGSISFAFTLRYLLRSIDELEEAALAVWDNAAKRSIRDTAESSTE